MGINRTTVAAVAGAAALLAGGGAALAGDDNGRSARCEERLARIAEHRGISVEQLEAEIKARVLARIEAARAAGRISEERAAALGSASRRATSAPDGVTAALRTPPAGCCAPQPGTSA